MARVHVTGPDGKTKVMHSIDARDLLKTGEYKLGPQPDSRSDEVARNVVKAAKHDQIMERVRKEMEDEAVSETTVEEVKSVMFPDFSKASSMDSRDLADYAAGFGIALDKRRKPDGLLEDFKAQWAKKFEAMGPKGLSLGHAQA